MDVAEREPAAPEAAPFGRYMLRERMARGGMGEVFRAVAVGAGGFEKPVVVKRILPQLGESDLLAEMFIEEARLMSRLVHPNIVKVIDFGQGQRDDYFLVMELVDGVDLGAFAKHYARQEGGMPVALALYVTSQVLRGLQHAHKKAYLDGRTLVHRDISPGNVLLSKVGEVKVADFGVAHVAHPDEASDPGTLVGKPSYMAPEQYAGEHIDVRADVWAVGVVLFQMLTQRMPFAGDSGSERQAAAKAGSLRQASTLRSDVGAPLDAVLAQALAFDPANRFGSARAMARAIDSLRDDGYAIATDEELAEAVELIAASNEDEARRVIALGSDTAATTVPAIHELTRTGPRGEFTMRVSQIELTERSLIRTGHDASDVSTREQTGDGVREDSAVDDDSEQQRPAPARLQRAAFLVVAILAGVGTWWFVQNRTEPTVTTPDPIPIATVSSARAVLSATTSASIETAATSQSTAAIATTSPSVSTAPRTLRIQPPAVSSTSATTTSTSTRATVSTSPPVANCRGNVLLSSKGGWWVTGGPRRVQAPGQYNWPCADYHLVGTSRLDGRSVSQSVSVRDGKLASARFQ